MTGRGDTPVVSNPSAELVGGGTNAKYVKECTELFLGNKGIEKLRGFEPFVNLTSLWLNNNKLKKINNLESNTRINTLHAHNNQICTLKGSIASLHFLQTLDLSNNQLRDLDKLLQGLVKLTCLKNLNLSGNPCCEEPDYRLVVIHRLPSLYVLDCHVVTAAERRKAAQHIGGDVSAHTVAFMCRAPPVSPAWSEKVPTRSLLEQELSKEAATIRDTQMVKAYEAEMALFQHNPHPDIPRGQTLPPNAGTQRARQNFAASQEHQLAGPGHEHRARGGLAKGRDLFGGSSPPNLHASLHSPPHARANSMPLGGRLVSMAGPPVGSPDAGFAIPQLVMPGSTMGKSGMSVKSAYSMKSVFAMAPAPEPPAAMKALAGSLPDHSSPYQPKDVLVINSCKPGHTDLATGLSRFYHVTPATSIKFDDKAYTQWVHLKSSGAEPWTASKTQVKIQWRTHPNAMPHMWDMQPCAAWQQAGRLRGAGPPLAPSCSRCISLPA